ncbi:hypothetical protein LTR33_018210, partial [Friedmanniomyces endolithicus]
MDSLIEFVEVPTAKPGISPACPAHCGIRNLKSSDSTFATARPRRITSDNQQHGAVSQQTSEKIRESLSGSGGGGEPRRWQAVNRGRFAHGNNWERKYTKTYKVPRRPFESARL